MKRSLLLLSLLCCAAALTGCAVDENGNPIIGVVPGVYGVVPGVYGADVAPYPYYDGGGVAVVDAGVYPGVVYTENDYYYRDGHRYLRADARARAARRGYGQGRLANGRGGYARGASHNPANAGRGGVPGRGGAPNRGAAANRGSARSSARPAPAPKKH